MDRQVEQLRHAALGERHEDTLDSLNDLATNLHLMGDHAEAEPLFKSAFELRREVLGERHADTLTSLNNLAASLKAQGRCGEARPLYEQALQTRREVLGEGHASTLHSMNKLADCLDGLGGEAEQARARELREEAVAAAVSNLIDFD